MWTRGRRGKKRPNLCGCLLWIVPIHFDQMHNKSVTDLRNEPQE